MATVETVSYMMIFAITIILTVISIIRLLQNDKRLKLDWVLPIIESFTFICWIIMVPLHLAFVGGASAFLEAPAILYFAFGILFLVLALKTVFDNLSVSTVIKNSVDTVD